MDFHHRECSFGNIVVPGHAGVVQAAQELLSVSTQAGGQVPGLALALAPAGPGLPGRWGPDREQGEDLVQGGLVTGPDDARPAGVDAPVASAGGGLGCDLGVHQDAGHLVGPSRERLGLAYGLEMTEGVSIALGVGGGCEKVVAGVAVVDDGAGV